jgi:hypothetical protein
MLPASMRRAPAAFLPCLLAIALAVALGACGEEEETEVVEGEPVALGELEYNVGLTRFLNPDDVEDAEYLAGQAAPGPGVAYLGVFLVIENESEEPQPSADSYVVHDTLDTEYEALESESPYALELGAEVPAEGELPLPNTTAETGPNDGALLIFEVDDSVSENRPLELEIESDAGTGKVILDI